MSAALALKRYSNLDAKSIVEKALDIAGDICIYTNKKFTIEVL